MLSPWGLWNEHKWEFIDLFTFNDKTVKSLTQELEISHNSIQVVWYDTTDNWEEWFHIISSMGLS